MNNPVEIARNLTKAQREAITDAARFLNCAAGEGIGQEVAPDETLWADDVVMRLCDAFGIEWGDDFGLAVRAELEKM